MSSEWYSSATVATRPERVVANPFELDVDVSSAIAERTPGNGEAAGAGAATGGPAGGDNWMSASD